MKRNVEGQEGAETPTDESVMEGEHPFADIPAAEETPEGEEPAVEEKPAPKLSYKTIKGEELGDEKLVDYVRTLETQLIEEQAKRSAFETVVKPRVEDEEREDEPKELDDSQLAEAFFTNPTGALAELRAQIKREILGEVGKKDATQTFWSGFYEAHEDLRGAEDIVEMVLERKKAEFARLPVSQASVKLAEAVRDRIKAFRAEPQGEGKVLPDRPAHSLSATPAKAPKGAAVAPVAALSFIDQLRERRNARKRKRGA